MPNRHYRRSIILNKTNSTFINQIISINNTTDININTTLNTPANANIDVNSDGNTIINVHNEIEPFSKIEQYYYDIIEAISNHMELNLIIQKSNNLINMFSSKDDAYNLLERVEKLALSIMQNICDNTSISIIQKRICYLQEQIALLPDGYEDYGEIGCLIFNIFDDLINGIDYKTIINNIDNLYNDFVPFVQLSDEYESIKNILCGIIQNITDNVPINIIQNRITFLECELMNISCPK